MSSAANVWFVAFSLHIIKIELVNTLMARTLHVHLNGG